MVLRRISVFVPLCVLWLACLLLLWGCGGGSDSFVAKDEPWRSAEERACLNAGAVRRTNFVQPHSALGGPSVCGTEHPFEMSAAMGGQGLDEPGRAFALPDGPSVDRWVAQVVEPAARFHFGSSISAAESRRLILLPPHEPQMGRRGFQNTATPTRSTSRPSRSRTGARSRSRAGGMAMPGRGPSCAPYTRGPASTSRPCWAPTTMPTIATTSTWISPATAATA